MSLEYWMAIDARLSKRLRVAEQPGILRSVAIFLAHSGDSWFWLLGLVLLWWRGSAYWQTRALTMGKGVLVTAVLVMALKFTIRRRRPEGDWGGIYRNTDPHSFPSGHAARAVMLAVLALGMGPVWFGVLLLIWSPLVGLARIAMGVHYPLDVAAGWILGVFMGGMALAFWM